MKLKIQAVFLVIKAKQVYRKVDVSQSRSKNSGEEGSHSHMNQTPAYRTDWTIPDCLN